MSIRSVAETAGGAVIGVAMIAIPILFLALFMVGAEWAVEFVLPWLLDISVLAAYASGIVLLPLAFFRRTRSFSGTSLFFTSYLFGTTAWLIGLFLTLSLWGWWAVLVGIGFFGVGVVPIAMLATIINDMWAELGTLALATGLTFGCRFLGLWLTDEL